MSWHLSQGWCRRESFVDPFCPSDDLWTRCAGLQDPFRQDPAAIQHFSGPASRYRATSRPICAYQGGHARRSHRIRDRRLSSRDRLNGRGLADPSLTRWCPTLGRSACWHPANIPTSRSWSRTGVEARGSDSLSMDASSSLTGALDLLQHDRGPAPSARYDDAAMNKVADDPVARRPVLSVVVVVGTKLPGAERGPAALGAKAHRSGPKGPRMGSTRHRGL